MKERDPHSLKIENIVVSGSVADSFDLKSLSGTVSGCTLDPKKFPGAVLHMQDPKSVALIFASGRVVITGLLTPEDVPVAVRNLVAALTGAGISCKTEPQVGIKNMVCSYNLGSPCNLTRIMIALMDTENIEYEPEVFPGLVCRITDPKVVFLLFSSGKTIITGGRCREDAIRGVEILKKKLSIADIQE